jgi:hypothetical protein
MPRFTEILGRKEGGEHKNRLKALIEDLEDGLVNYLIYMPSVRKFFKEDVPRVIRLGDSQGWQAVDYHVNPRCSSCDWLGNPNWLVGDDKTHYEKNPDHYCFQQGSLTRPDIIRSSKNSESRRLACKCRCSEKACAPEERSRTDQSPSRGARDGHM